ncbi:MAG TPA: hypothetical protein VE081_04300 [Sporichthyaceae bacterium]|nr:hypothetical protein [Sporichthyaceae bacterium]
MRRAFGTLMAAMMLAMLAGGSAMAAPAPAPAPGGPSLPLCLGVDVLGLDLGQGSACASGVAPS